MSGMSEEEKFQQIEASFRIDDIYLRSLDRLREDLTEQGVDIDTGEGRKIFIREVRRLNESFYIKGQ